MQFHALLAVMYDGFLLSVCLFAVVRGGRPERLGALINLLASVASSAARLLTVASWAPAQIVILGIDLGVVVGFYWLATRTVRFWPLWALGFAIADIFISLAGAFLPNVMLLAYATGMGVYAYLALAALAMGTFCLPRDASPVVRRGFRRQCIRPPSSA